MIAAATSVAGPSGRTMPQPNKNSNALRQQWSPVVGMLTSEYEYHEPTNQSRNQQFGSQVALSGDGSTMAVADVWYYGGSEWPWYGSGAVYVYRRAGEGWRLEARLEPPAARGYDFFGSDVALSMAGNVLAIGAQNEGYDAPSQDAGPGSVFVYKRRSGVWTQEAMLRASREQDSASFGRTVEMSSAGDVIAVGAPYESIDAEGATQTTAGAVYLFAKSAGAWVQQQAVTAPVPRSYDLFGWGVRLSENGRTLGVLAAEQNYDTEDFDAGGWPNRVNTVYVFQKHNGGSWNLTTEFEGSASEPHFGGTAYEPEGQTEGFDVSDDGRTLAIGSPFARADDGTTGVVRIYRRPGQQWQPGPVLKPALPERRSFGIRVTLSAHGKSLVAFADRDDGAYGQPYVVAFDQLQNQWRQTAVFGSPADVPSASGFANSLSLSWSGQYLASGARTYATEDSTWGAVFNYRRQASPAAASGK